MTMSELKIRTADESDTDRIKLLDRHISPDELRSIILCGRVLIAECDEKWIGWLRYNLFWDNTPFMNMLFLLEEYRRKGFGKRLVCEWEKQMASTGFQIVLTSTRADEAAQHFYRRIGYKDCGALFLPDQEPTEIFLYKTLIE